METRRPGEYSGSRQARGMVGKKMTNSGIVPRIQESEIRPFWLSPQLETQINFLSTSCPLLTMVLSSGNQSPTTSGNEPCGLTSLTEQA